MPKYRDLDRGDVLPASFLDALQEFLTNYSGSVVLSKSSATSVQVQAGPGSDRVALGVYGLWRYIETSASATVVGTPSAGSLDVVAVASANVFAATPAPDTDLTDYSFGLRIVGTGVAPTGLHNGASIASYRKIGTVTWDGSAIVAVQQVGVVPPDYVKLDEQAPAGGVITFSGISQQFRHLRLVGSVQAAFGNSGNQLGLKINGDSVAHYVWQYWHLNPGVPGGAAVEFGTAVSPARLGEVAQHSNDATQPQIDATRTTFTLDLPFYTDPAAKTWHGQLSDSSGKAQLCWGTWPTVAVSGDAEAGPSAGITALSLLGIPAGATGPGLAALSRVSLYGLR